MNPYYEDDHVTIYHGDSFDILHNLSGIGAVVTDPPYSSGGNYRGDRVQSTATKYSNIYRPEFGNDHFDQRAFQLWTEAWMRAAKLRCEPSALLVSFIDWRQLPALTDAMQFAGWSWQGLAVWHKGFGRPSPGRFSNAAEYVAWGSNGALAQHETYPPGVFSCPTPTDKKHTAQKPDEVMRWVMQVVPPGALVLDPFMGSGTTLRAAKDCNRKAIGIEVDERYCEIAARRMAQEVLPL